ncbi:MAG: hypothetical protein ABI571_02905, partial [Actinomycetota bacterium]
PNTAPAAMPRPLGLAACCCFWGGNSSDRHLLTEVTVGQLEGAIHRVQGTTVTSRDDFWYRKYTETPERTAAPVFTGGAQQEPAEEPHIHMPDPSYFPVLAAAGLPMMGYGVLYADWAIVAGGLIVLLGLFGWVLEPGSEEAH